MKKWLIVACTLLAAIEAGAVERGWRFATLDDGTIDLTDRDGAVLLVNTASLCAFIPQHHASPELHGRYGSRVLLVVAVPANDFRQEMGDDVAVAESSDVNFDLTLPSAVISKVPRAETRPILIYLKDEYGVVPRWNLYQFLLADGDLTQARLSFVRPESTATTMAIEAALK